MSRRFALALVLFAGTGCSSEMGGSVPSMIEVSDVQPREVEVGDRLEILGAGFPLKRTAHILLRGTVHRPGLVAEPVAIAIDAETRSEGRLEIPLSSQITDRIVGAGDAALHATFRGEVVVSFAPAEAGTAALTGKATGVVLDVRPERSRSPAIARREESGKKLLEFLGLTIGAAAPASGGLLVTGVKPGSPAANVGIEAQDVIVDFEGVRVAGISDLAPSSDLATLGVRRDGDAIRSLAIPLAGFSQRVPRSMIAAALMVSIASVLVLLGAAKPSARRAFVERAAAERLRLGARALLRRGLPSLALVCAIAPALPIAQTMLGIDLDVGALLCVGGAALLALSLAEERSGTALSVARDQLPAVLGAATVVIATGSLRLDDVLRAQGAAPWEWFAFRTPATSLAFVMWLAAASAPKSRSGRGPTHEAAIVVSSVLAAALFLGGWRLPGLTIERDVWSVWHLVAAAGFALKAGAIAAILRIGGSLLPVETHRIHSTWRTRVPLAAAATLATAVMASFSPSPALLRVLGLGTFVFAMALLAFAVLRAASSVRKIAVRHVDPAI